MFKIIEGDFKNNKYSDEEYLDYMKKDEEYIKKTNDIPYEFVENFVNNMIQKLNLFQK